MSRLTHSPAGFLKGLQISRKHLFAFVEGVSNDEYFYSRICEIVCRGTGLDFECNVARNLPGGAGGKKALLKFLEYARRSSKLASKFKDKTTVLVFFVDKDIDEILRRKLRSPHVVYTKFYDIESHLFAEGNLTEAAAATGSVDRRLVAAAFGPPADWRLNKALLWKDWIKLCVFCQRYSVKGSSNYGARSEINENTFGPRDDAKLKAKVAQLRTQAGLIPAVFNRRLETTSRQVDRLYDDGRHDEIFKGKWYSAFAEEDLAAIAGRQRARGTGSRIATALAVTIDFDADWSRHFRDPVAALIAATV
jgi:hypothetical protein